MESIIQKFAEDADVQSLAAGIRAGMDEQLASGLAGSSKSVLITALFSELDRSLVVLTHNMFAAQKLAEDLRECLQPERVLLYAAHEVTLTEAAAASPELTAERIDALSRLVHGFRGVIVVPYAGVRRLLPVKDTFASAHLSMKTGQEIPMQEVLSKLASLGYERVEQVEQPGEFSVRGGIIDVYPITELHPYRMEWFDDEIDSIRQFDTSTQRSICQVQEITILPCKELIAEERRFENAAQHVYERLQEQLEKISDRPLREKLQQSIMRDIERLRERTFFPGLHKYISFLYPERHTLIDYLPEDAVFIVDEPIRLLETAKQLEREEAEVLTSLQEEGRALPSFVLSKPYDSLIPYTKQPKLYLSLFLRQIPHTQPKNIVNFVCRAMQNFHSQMHLLKSETERWRKTEQDIVLMAASKERAERLKRILGDYHIEGTRIVEGNLQHGFEFPSSQLVVITESEVFNQKQRKARKVEKRIENAERIKSYTELRVGDYVVHINHGIGKYVGIGTLEVGGIHKDYLHIMYAGGDKLSVPIEQIDAVQKYIGSEEKEPKLNKLGGNEWKRIKSKARSSVRDIADDLIKLYAERQASKGHAFSKDTPYQKEFEDLFPYEETPDQIRTIREIKKDMEKPVPMDRLLCGDVGYGKTEVAIRAAFKAAIDGKQVAVLVPTTILAQQHYETFRERFSGYPFQIEVLSRFRSRKEQTETIKGLKQGTVDIVIGTHRLLSADIKFKSLGLLIVDEEQRFGVSHKEKLKALKTNVDVLTLTATPIPRTLHMSMLGVRDLSVIETPPENRFPVQTYVVEYSRTLVREAIEREMARGGQVYYLYNRVQGIYQMAESISELVPDARVAVCHGQMTEQELEQTILNFLDGEYDVLVSTSIIETGVDIPNVNTLIVHDADKMGLSQLYQLRGRVGRSNRVAYAYFTYQQDKTLSEVAEKRLQAIREFTELGSGFKIAMRDLAIRGAGNLLGAEQHGFIASVGFDLYSQMLSEEIAKRKRAITGEAEEERPSVSTQISMDIDAYLPSDYIHDSIQKIEIYKKVASIQDVEDTDEIYDELIDRFGDLPEAVTNLLYVAKLKAYGRAYGIEQISQKPNYIELRMEPGQNTRVEGRKLVAVGNRFDGRLQFHPGSQISITLNTRGLQQKEIMELLERFLVQYREVLKQKGEVHNVAQ